MYRYKCFAVVVVVVVVFSFLYTKHIIPLTVYFDREDVNRSSLRFRSKRVSGIPRMPVVVFREAWSIACHKALRRSDTVDLRCLLSYQVNNP